MKKILLTLIAIFYVAIIYGQLDSIKVSTPNSGLGDPLRTAMQKTNLAIDQINLNTTEIGTLTPGQVLTVAASGGDYTSIQTAIDAITDNSITKPYVIFIYPGTYTENITMEDFVTLDGEGKRSDVVIDGSITFPVVASDKSSLKDLMIINDTCTVTGFKLITIPIGSGTYNIDHCLLSVTNTTNADTASIIDQNGGSLTIKRTDFLYDFNGSAADAHRHYIFDITGTSSYNIYDCSFDVDIYDVDDAVILINEDSTATIGESFIHSNVFHLNVSNAAYSGDATGFFLHGGGVDKSSENNHLHLTSDGNGRSYFIRLNTDLGNGKLMAIGNSQH